MDSDDDLQAAVQSGCSFALVRVLGVAVDKSGTRSQTTAYACEVVCSVDQASFTASTLKHFGPPLLDVEGTYVVGARDSHRHHGAWELRFAAAAGEPATAVAEFCARRAALPIS